MKYLLDTNIYIAAYDRYYRKEYFPTYWERFAEIINDYVVVPKVVKDEVTKSSWFLQWLADNYRGDILNHKDYAYQWQIILDFVRSSGLYKDEALTSQMTGWADDHIADPWLIAIAKEKDLIIVSEETRDPNLGKGNPIRRAKMPDVCDRQSIRCIDRNEFFGEIGLSV